MMKTLFKILSTVAFALVLFVPAKNAYSGDNFPPGVTFGQGDVVGAILDPTATALRNAVNHGDGIYTTMDAINFGFMTRYVQICLRRNSVDSYFRMNTSVSKTTIGGGTDLNKWELSTSANFIQGNASFDYGALSMTAQTTTGGAGDARGSTCITQPWRTRGLLMHIASGTATADVWGYR